MAPLRRTKPRLSGPYDSKKQQDKQDNEHVGSVSTQLPPGPVASSPVEYADASYPESKLVQDIIPKRSMSAWTRNSNLLAGLMVTRIHSRVVIHG